MSQPFEILSEEPSNRYRDDSSWSSFKIEFTAEELEQKDP